MKARYDTVRRQLVWSRNELGGSQARIGECERKPPE